MRRYIDIPPLWLLVFLVIVFGLSYTATPMIGLPARMLGGLAIVALLAAIVLTLLAIHAFWTHKTTIIPHETPASLITTGIFGLTRNPIYLADALILLAAALWWDRLLALLLVPAFVVLIDRRFIRGEEHRMRDAFGGDFTAYVQKVRRWM